MNALEDQERRGLVLLKEKVPRQRQNIIDPEAAANRSLSVPERIPSKSDAGFKVAKRGVRIVWTNAAATGPWLWGYRGSEQSCAYRRGIRNVDQIRDPALGIVQHGRHFIAQAEIEGQVRFHFPVVLHIGANKRLAEFPRLVDDWQFGFKGERYTLQGERGIVELIEPPRVLECVLVVIHTLDASAKFDSVSTVGPESIVVYLVGIPGVKIVRARI